MSEENNGTPQNGGEHAFEEIRQKLSSIIGEQAANEIIASMQAQGFNPAAFFQAGFPGMLSGFHMHSTSTPDLSADPDAPAQNPQENTQNGFSQIFSGENFTIISQQIRDLLGAGGSGPVNWKIAEEVARQTITRKNLDSLNSSTAEEARNALRTASLWLDAATEFGPITGKNMAWNRLDWIAHSLATYKRLLDPVGANISRAIIDTLQVQLGELPEQLNSVSAMIGNPGELFGSLIATVLGIQYGTALAQLAQSSFGTSDTGLPLMEASTAALVPANISEFAKDLAIEETEVLTYIAVRELAAARLFTHVPWLRTRVLDTVAEYAAGIEIDPNAVEEKIRDISLETPHTATEIDLTDIFALDISPAQQEILARLEHLISLIEGWVSEISARAVAPHLPNAVRLREMFTRRYATDNPAKNVWEMQLGMQLTPRTMRDAVAFWQMAEAKLGISERDALWNHPDLLPNAEILSNDLQGFFSNEPRDDISAELDSFLEDLFKTADVAQNQEEAEQNQEKNAGLNTEFIDASPYGNSNLQNLKNSESDHPVSSGDTQSQDSPEDRSGQEN